MFKEGDLRSKPKEHDAGDLGLGQGHCIFVQPLGSGVNCEHSDEWLGTCWESDLPCLLGLL